MSKTALSLAARRSADSHPRCAGPLLSALRRPYSNKNRMKSVSWVVSSVTQTQSYAINALGQRIKKTKTAGTAPQATVHFTYDEAGRLTGEYNANNQLVQEVLWLDDMPVATLRPRAGQTLQTIPSTAGAGIIVGQLSGATIQVIDAFHIHADHLNTPRVITRPSDNKKVWEWANTEPFGNNAPNENPQAVGTFTFNLAFPGQYRDKETGLSYNYFRDYNPTTGRYVQSDPIGLDAGVNTYSYVEGDPLRAVDEYGLRKKPKPPQPGGPKDKPGPGTGTCGVEEHRNLQRNVNLFCKFPGLASTCSFISQCISSREHINKRCYGGGDSGHNQAIKDKKTQYCNECTGGKGACCDD